MPPLRFIRMWLGRRLRTRPHDVWDIVIHQLVHRHDPSNSPHRDRRLGQEAPEAKLPGIGMPLLDVGHRNHQGQPDLARR